MPQERVLACVQQVYKGCGTQQVEEEEDDIFVWCYTTLHHTLHYTTHHYLLLVWAMTAAKKTIRPCSSGLSDGHRSIASDQD